MRPAILLAFAFFLLPLAAAQPGPAPGYDDPLLYARDYSEQQASDAAMDPAGYATEHASASAVVAEARHGAYVACWTVDVYAQANPEPCDAFFEPAGEVTPAAEEEAQAVDDATNATLAAAEDLVDEGLDIIEETLEDPTSAPSQLQRLASAVATFAGAVLMAVGGLLSVTAQTVADLVEGVAGTHVAIASTAADVVAAAGTSGAALAAEAASGLASGLGHATQTAAAWSEGTVNGIGTLVDAGATAHRQTTDMATTAMADAAGSMQQAAADLAAGAKDVARGVAQAVSQAWTSLFGAGDGPAETLDPDRVPGGVADQAGGLLDTVTGLAKAG